MNSHRLTFTLGDVTVATEVSSPQLLSLVETFYPDYQIDSLLPPRIRLWDDDGGFRIWADVAGAFVSRDRLSLPEAIFLYELLLSERLLNDQPTHSLHAGGVEVGGRVLLLSGWGGSGKSSLVAAFAGRGYKVYGDDVALLERESGLIKPFRRLIKLLDPVPSLLGLSPAAAATSHLWPEGHYSPSELGSDWAEAGPLAWVVFPRFDSAARHVEIESLSGGETMKLLMEQILLAPTVGSDEFAALSHALEGSRFFRCRFSDVNEAAESLLEILKEP